MRREGNQMRQQIAGDGTIGEARGFVSLTVTAPPQGLQSWSGTATLKPGVYPDWPDGEVTVRVIDGGREVTGQARVVRELISGGDPVQLQLQGTGPLHGI